jgi:hypothetical protein
MFQRKYKRLISLVEHGPQKPAGLFLDNFLYLPRSLKMQFTRLLIALSTVLGITSVLGLPLATEETSFLATRDADAMIYEKRGQDGM